MSETQAEPLPSIDAIDTLLMAVPTEDEKDAFLGEKLEVEKVEEVLETRLVPIELTNVNISVELRIPVKAAATLEETQSILERLRAKFGEDSLIEELSQVLCGTVEKVRISRPEGSKAQHVSQPQQQAPVQVHIPQANTDAGAYCVQSAQTPWKGVMLKNINPVDIYNALYVSPQHKALLTNQDQVMMDAYYRWWHEQQAVQPKIETVSFAADDLPY